MGEGIWRQVNGTCKGPGLSLNPVCLAGVGSAQARSQIEPQPPQGEGRSGLCVTASQSMCSFDLGPKKRLVPWRHGNLPTS